MVKRKARINVYKHEIDLTDLKIKNQPKDKFREALEKIKYKGYEVEKISDGRKIIISKPGGKFTFGTIKKEDFMVWIYNPDEESLWLISHQNISDDLRAKAACDSKAAFKILEALERVYNGEEPDDFLSEVRLVSPCGENPEVILKVYKWIWGQEDCNYPSPKYKGRAMSWEGWKKVDEDLVKTGDGLLDLKEELKKVLKQKND
ncbi:MAG: hypothetical protein WC543_05240 [Candidatus Omnitrophota bacterium]